MAGLSRSRSSVSRIVPLALPALVMAVLAVAVPHGTGFSLQKEWQVSMGPLQRGVYLYRTAVCPDGSVYFTDRQGRLGLLGPDGALIEDRVLIDTVGASAVACDEAGHPIVAVATPEGRHVIALDTSHGFAVLWKSRDFPVPITALLARSGHVFALAPPAAGAKAQAFLYRISSDGVVSAPFGTPPVLLAGSLAHQSLSDGSLLWSVEAHELMFLSSGSNELQSYTASGQMTRTAYRQDPGFMPFALGGNLEYRPRDVLNSAVRLPGGEIAGFVTKVIETGSQAYVEILRPEGDRLVPEPQRVSIRHDGGFGFLSGADDTGAPYFNRGLDRKEATIIRARLVAD